MAKGWCAVVAERNYAYCKVFVKGVPVDELPADLPTVPGVELETRRNKGVTGPVADQRRAARSVGTYADPEDDFLRWPTLVELYVDEEEGQRAIVSVAAQLLRQLWDAGMPAVAACDFEDELPWAGGIQRLTRR